MSVDGDPQSDGREPGVGHAVTDTAAQAERRRGRIARLLAVAVTAIGLAVRLYGIGWSLPDARHPVATYHPDELVNLNAARAADIVHGQFDIKFYNYGTLYFYLVDLARTIATGYGAIPASPAGTTPLDPAAAPENAALFLTGRLVTALMGAATIGVLFALGSRLYGRKAGVLAALLYAITPIAALQAHFLTVDVPATLFVALALHYAVRIADTGAIREYALAGLFVGLAAATKYNAGLVIAAPLAAHVVRHRGTAAAYRIAILIIATLAVFLIACPGPWLNPQAFWNGLPNYPGSGVRYELFEHARAGHGLLFVNTGPGWWYHLTVSLRCGLGVPLLLLSLLGLLPAGRRRTPGDWILFAFFAVYFGVAGLSTVRFARYMIPIVPVLCLWAARLLVTNDFKCSGTLAYRGLGLACVLLTAAYTVTLVMSMAARDPRDVAADRLLATAPAEASIAFATVPWYYSPPLSPYFGLLAAPDRARAAADSSRFRLLVPRSEWDVSVLTPLPDYVVLSSLETMNAVERLRLPAPVRFVRDIPVEYIRIVVRPARVFDASAVLPGAMVPEDMLYTRPSITIYANPASVEEAPPQRSATP